MTHLRHTWALPALALTLILAACSTPEDLTAPTLEPQFGTSGYDTVIDVDFHKLGYLYVVGDKDNYTYLRRYDRSGKLYWEKTFQNSSVTYVQAVATDGSGNVFVAGLGTGNYLQKFDKYGKVIWSTGTAPINDLVTDSSGNLYAVAGGHGYVTKYTTSGKKVWERWGFPAPQSAAVSSAGNLYVVRGDGMVAKYSSSGSRLWAKKLLPGDQDFTDECDEWACYQSYDVSYRIAAGVSDEFIVLGGVFDYFYDGDSSSNTSATLYLHRFDKNGVQKWRKEAQHLSYYEDWYYDSDYSAGGWLSFGFDTDTYGNAYVVSGNGANASATKYTSTGAKAWLKEFGTPEEDGATSVSTADGTEIFVGGMTEGYLTHAPLGDQDAFLRKMDKNGNRIWTR